jgi:hypothetical protein
METHYEVRYCNIDKLYYIYKGENYIHHQQTKPKYIEWMAAIQSDQWNEVFKQIKEGKKVRVSDRIYYNMLGAVPPIRQTLGSFYCGECYSDNLYYYFETIEGKRYGSLKPL